MDESSVEEGRLNSILKPRNRFPLQEVPGFFPEDDTVTNTFTRNRRVSFGRKCIKEFQIGSAVTTQALDEYEHSSSFSEQSECSGPLDLALNKTCRDSEPEKDTTDDLITPPECFSDSKQRAPEDRARIFTENCISIAKSVFQDKETELTAIIIGSKPSVADEDRKNTSSMNFSTLEMSSHDFVAVRHPELIFTEQPHTIDKSRFDFLDQPSSKAVIRGSRMSRTPLACIPVQWDDENGENIPPAHRSYRQASTPLHRVTDVTMEFTCANVNSNRQPVMRNDIVYYGSDMEKTCGMRLNSTQCTVDMSCTRGVWEEEEDVDEDQITFNAPLDDFLADLSGCSDKTSTGSDTEDSRFGVIQKELANLSVANKSFRDRIENELSNKSQQFSPGPSTPDVLPPRAHSLLFTPTCTNIKQNDLEITRQMPTADDDTCTGLTPCSGDLFSPTLANLKSDMEMTEAVGRVNPLIDDSLLASPLALSPGSVTPIQFTPTCANISLPTAEDDMEIISEILMKTGEENTQGEIAPTPMRKSKTSPAKELDFNMESSQESSRASTKVIENVSENQVSRDLQLNFVQNSEHIESEITKNQGNCSGVEIELTMNQSNRSEPGMELTLNQSKHAEAENEPEMDLTMNNSKRTEAENEPEMELTMNNSKLTEAENEPEMELTMNNSKLTEAEHEPEMELTMNNSKLTEAEKEPEMELTMNNSKLIEAENEPEMELTMNNSKLTGAENEPEMELTMNQSKLKEVEAVPEVEHTMNQSKLSEAENEPEMEMTMNQSKLKEVEAVPEVEHTMNQSKLTEAENEPEMEVPLNRRNHLEAESETEHKLDHTNKEVENEPEIEMTMNQSKHNEVEIEPEMKMNHSKSAGAEIEPNMEMTMSLSQSTGAENEPELEVTMNMSKSAVAEIESDMEMTTNMSKSAVAEIEPEMEMTMNQTKSAFAEIEPDMEMTMNMSKSAVAGTEPEMEMTMNQTKSAVAEIEPEMEMTMNMSKSAVAEIEPEMEMTMNQTKSAFAGIEPDMEMTMNMSKSAVAENEPEMETTMNQTESAVAEIEPEMEMTINLSKDRKSKDKIVEHEPQVENEKASEMELAMNGTRRCLRLESSLNRSNALTPKSQKNDSFGKRFHSDSPLLGDSLLKKGRPSASPRVTRNLSSIMNSSLSNVAESSQAFNDSKAEKSITKSCAKMTMDMSQNKCEENVEDFVNKEANNDYEMSINNENCSMVVQESSEIITLSSDVAQINEETLQKQTNTDALDSCSPITVSPDLEPQNIVRESLKETDTVKMSDNKMQNQSLNSNEDVDMEMTTASFAKKTVSEHEENILEDVVLGEKIISIEKNSRENVENSKIIADSNAMLDMSTALQSETSTKVTEEESVVINGITRLEITDEDSNQYDEKTYTVEAAEVNSKTFLLEKSMKNKRETYVIVDKRSHSDSPCPLEKIKKTRVSNSPLRRSGRLDASLNQTKHEDSPKQNHETPKSQKKKDETQKKTPKSQKIDSFGKRIHSDSPLVGNLLKKGRPSESPRIPRRLSSVMDQDVSYLGPARFSANLDTSVTLQDISHDNEVTQESPQNCVSSSIQIPVENVQPAIFLSPKPVRVSNFKETEINQECDVSSTQPGCDNVPTSPDEHSLAEKLEQSLNLTPRRLSDVLNQSQAREVENEVEGVKQIVAKTDEDSSIERDIPEVTENIQKKPSRNSSSGANKTSPVGKNHERASSNHSSSESPRQRLSIASPNHSLHKSPCRKSTSSYVENLNDSCSRVEVRPLHISTFHLPDATLHLNRNPVHCVTEIETETFAKTINKELSMTEPNFAMPSSDDEDFAFEPADVSSSTRKIEGIPKKNNTEAESTNPSMIDEIRCRQSLDFYNISNIRYSTRNDSLVANQAEVEEDENPMEGVELELYHAILSRVQKSLEEQTENSMCKIIKFETDLIMIDFTLLEPGLMLNIAFDKQCKIVSLKTEERKAQKYQNIYKQSVNAFGYQFLKKLIDGQRQKCATLEDLPLYVELFSNFCKRLNETMIDALTVVKGCGGAKVEGQTLTFPLHYFIPITYCRLHLDLSDMVMYGRPALSFTHEEGRIDEQHLQSLLQESQPFSLQTFVKSAVDYTIKYEEGTGFVTKRMPLLF